MYFAGRQFVRVDVTVLVRVRTSPSLPVCLSACMTGRLSRVGYSRDCVTLWSVIITAVYGMVCRREGAWRRGAGITASAGGRILIYTVSRELLIA